MDSTQLIAFAATGFVIGGFAVNPIAGAGLGLFGSILVGMIGGVVGGSLLSSVEIFAGGLVGAVAAAAIGSFLLLFTASKFLNRR